MLFGEKAAVTVLGKTQHGYAGGNGEQASRPMARFLLDEMRESGESSLTLHVDKGIYDRLLVGAHGTVSWRGEKCLGFAPDDQETDSPQKAEAPAQAEPPEETGAADYLPPGHVPPEPPPAKGPMDCPWCGKEMGRWRMNSRDSLILKRETQEEFSLKKWWNNREKNRITLVGGDFFNDGLLVYVCEDCQKAAIDYKDGACIIDYHS